MMKPLRIIYVLPYVPSPIRVRPYQLIRFLARAGHRVTVAALSDEFATEESLSELRGVCDAVHIVPHSKRRGALQAALALPTHTPLWAAFCFSPAMDAKLRELVATGAFDVAHIEHLRAAHFAPALAPLPAVFDAVDCITALRRQMIETPGGSLASHLLSRLEWSRLRAYEPGVCRTFGQVAVTSEYDRAELQRLDAKLSAIAVIPNGVDTDYFFPDESIVAQPDTLVFSGKMSYDANDDAARFLLTDILPRLRRVRPKTRAVIAGSKPSDSLRALAEKIGGVTVTGFVDDLRPYLSGASLAVCPMRVGVGIQNKALEAMAMARPVVCSPIAARAFGKSAADGNVGIAVADTADEFARVCAEWFSAPGETLRDKGRAARAYVEARHNWQVAADDFAALYKKVIVGTPPNTA